MTRDEAIKFYKEASEHARKTQASLQKVEVPLEPEVWRAACAHSDALIRKLEDALQLILATPPDAEPE